MDPVKAETTLNLIEARVKDAHAANGGDNAAITPIFGLIIQFILSLLSGGGICPTPTPIPTPAPADAATKIKASIAATPLYNQVVMTNACLMQGFSSSRRAARALAAGIIGAAANSTQDELTTMATVAQAMNATADNLQ